MRFLLDTNVFIALEPTATDTVEPGTVGALAFAKLASEGKHELAIHPAIRPTLTAILAKQGATCASYKAGATQCSPTHRTSRSR